MTKHEVGLVRFPLDGHSSTKVRPAVCLTEPIGPHQHLILAFVSSRIPASPLDTDLLIDSSDADVAAGRAAGLMHDSRPHVSGALPDRLPGRRPSRGAVAPHAGALGRHGSRAGDP